MDLVDNQRLAELARIVVGFTRADYDLVRRRLATLADERGRLQALEALIRAELNLRGEK